jgi:U4/U6.U5 tri-snRNP-associated protein 1
MGEDVIELSVDETNKLRAELGLAPLRGAAKAASAPPPPVSVTTNSAATSSNKEMLELSVEETNNLRAKLGLKPLSVKKEDIHKPAVNDGAQKELEEWLEKEKLKRQVQQGISSTFGSETLGNSKGDALSWAEKMRTTTETKKAATGGGERKKKKKKKAAAAGVHQNYDDADLEGINVSHAVSDFEAGSTTILTLADTSLLKQSEHSSKAVGLNDEEDDQRLENVQLADTQVQRDRLRQKRQVEMGMGRAGGYAGYDDDEFEELGGAQGPSRLARGQDLGSSGDQDNSSETAAAKKHRGFQIGSSNMHDDEEDASDLFAQHRGKAVSLEQSVADVAASDFMTTEEDAALNPMKKKKDTKFKKKKKKKDKKNKRKVDDEEDDNEAEAPPPVGSILDDLEQTAVVPGKRRKRRRGDDDQDGAAPATAAADGTEKMDAAKRRARFDEIMEKGNKQTATVFSKPASSQQDEEMQSIDEEPDDNFLHEALAKARRLKKLREMSSQKPKDAADTVAQAVLDSKKMNTDNQAASSSATTGGLSFELNETREFTRALRARTEQAERQKAKKQAKPAEFTSVKKEEAPPEEPNGNNGAVMLDVDPLEAAEAPEPTQGMAELAKQIEEDEPDPEVATGIDGSSGSATVGRGMAGFVSMLRHTGEISGRNAGREEMRGRAKDARTYDDYEPLNLNEVVRIGKNATDKDKELASREIKLDYRDEHGRLLTRKEAYRNLCYQFHGHGSSAKNQEKRLRQVEREQAEARLASRQGGGAGSLGALKATQKATGKAFVVHKT